MEQNDKSLWQVVKGYFNALPDKEDEEETIKQISNSIVFHGANLWVLVFAIFIASLGLNVNSTAVIIGAMLISPLMGPIIGMGLAIGVSDLELLKRSIKNYLVATVISVLTATLYFLITPLTEAQSELLARTSPTLYDVLIALCGGAAGILALATKGKGNVIPGVAIATALMPPLCTAGYGLAVGNLSFFFGAFYLFFINTVFIALSTFVGVRMLRFGHKSFVDPARLAKVNRYIIGIVVLTMLPASYMTVQIIRRSVLDNNTRKFVKNELTFKGTQIISQNRDEDTKTLRVVAVGRSITPKAIDQARSLLDDYQLGDYKLSIIQGSQSDSLLLSQSLTTAAANSEASSRRLIEQAEQISQLETQLGSYTRYADMGKSIREEVKAISPAVTSISLSRITEARTDTTATRQYVMAVAGVRRGVSLNERRQLKEWLKARTKADSLRLIVTSAE
ncbi:MAG: TIGR00341 family protein [Prevotella sp.]|nr:TIGR00341 family protein [Prevotella sp.]